MKSVIDRRYPLEQIPEADSCLEKRQKKEHVTAAGGIIAEPNQALHPTAIPLRFIAADELGGCAD